eukprot:1096299_1
MQAMDIKSPNHIAWKTRQMIKTMGTLGRELTTCNDVIEFIARSLQMKDEKEQKLSRNNRGNNKLAEKQIQNKGLFIALHAMSTYRFFGCFEIYMPINIENP